jgi:hypothetical protein
MWNNGGDNTLIYQFIMLVTLESYRYVAYVWMDVLITGKQVEN